MVIRQRNVVAHDISGESTYRAFRYLKQEEKAIYRKLIVYYFSCPMMEWEEKATDKQRAYTIQNCKYGFQRTYPSVKSIARSFADYLSYRHGSGDGGMAPGEVGYDFVQLYPSLYIDRWCSSSLKLFLRISQMTFIYSCSPLQ